MTPVMSSLSAMREASKNMQKHAKTQGRNEKEENGINIWMKKL